MKVNDIINEGPLDWAKNIGSKVSGLAQNVTAYNQQQKALQDYKELAKEAGQEWNRLVASYRRQPGMTPDALSALLVQYMDQRHKDKYNKQNTTNIQPPKLTSISDAATANKYIFDRMIEYFGRQRSTQAPTGQLPAGYPLPKQDAEIEYRGYDIVYDAGTKQWYNKETGDVYADKNSINILNKTYYDQQKKQGAAAAPPTPSPAPGPTAAPAASPPPASAAAPPPPAQPGKSASGLEKIVAEPVDDERTYGKPKRDAEVNFKGKDYGFTTDDNSWHEDDTGADVDDLNLVKQLNKRYYDLKDLSKVGKADDPDDPAYDVFDPENTVGGALKQGPKNKVTDIATKKAWKPLDPLSEGNIIKEGGNAIPSSTPVLMDDVKTVVELAKKFLPAELVSGLQTDIGSAGYKIKSGDIDIMVEAEDVVNLFKTHESKDPVKEAKQKLKVYFEGKGVEANVNGRNVSIGIVYTNSLTEQKQTAQVDVMVIHEAAVVAPWHQHGLRGMYNDPEFKGSELFMLISSIAKHLGLKFDAFGAKLLRRDNNEVVGRTRKEVAKILLGPGAREEDLDSVKSMLKALEKDPDREGKLAQARQDAAKGLMRLPETAGPGTAAWFRQISDSLV